MTNDEFAFWERAFLAAIAPSFWEDDGRVAFDSKMKDGAVRIADAALAVWREKRASVEREHVGKVVTNG